jgi:hypothetical protein
VPEGGIAVSVSPHETLIRDYVEAVFNRHELDDLSSYWIEDVIIGRFADGKLAEDWVEYDRLGLYRQLGVIPLGGDS